MRVFYGTDHILVDSDSSFRDLLYKLGQDATRMMVRILTTDDRVVRDLNDSLTSHGLGPRSVIAAKGPTDTEPRMPGGMRKRALLKVAETADLNPKKLPPPLKLAESGYASPDIPLLPSNPLSPVFHAYVDLVPRPQVPTPFCRDSRCA